MTLSATATDALELALLHIHEHPEEWDQDSWFGRNDCGTTACLAGRIAIQQGMTSASHPLFIMANGSFVDEAVAAALIVDSTDPEGDLFDIHGMFSAYANEASLWDQAQELANRPLLRPAGV